MRKSPLLARVAKLEAALTPRTFPRMVFSAYDAESLCQGVSGPSGAIVPRVAGESTSDLLARSVGILGSSPALWFTYPEEWLNAEEQLPESACTRSEPEPEPKPVDNWPDLAGIGRQATREELERWGVIAVPAERLL